MGPSKWIQNKSTVKVQLSLCLRTTPLKRIWDVHVKLHTFHLGIGWRRVGMNTVTSRPALSQSFYQLSYLGSVGHNKVISWLVSKLQSNIAIRLGRSHANSMEQSPFWESKTDSASPQIYRLLWKTNVQNRLLKDRSLLPNLRQMKPFHNFPFYFLKICYNIFRPTTPRFYEWSLPFRFCG